MAKANKQPTPKKGFEFNGWATFNWGMCHQKVYRTRKQAIDELTKYGDEWKDVKKYMKVVKVKCIVL